MNKQVLVDAAVNALDHYICDSMEFPDAEGRVAREFSLTEDELREVREIYDEMNT